MSPGGDPAGLTGAQLARSAQRDSGALYRFARSLTRSEQAAEDLVQQSYLRAWERREQFAGGSLLAWLRRILANLVIDEARHRHQETTLADEALADAVDAQWRDAAYSVDPAVVTERAQVRAEVEDALIRLPYTARAVLVLHDEQGWTLAEVAEVLEISLPAAKQRLRRGRMMLVSALATGAERRRATSGVPMSCWDARREVSDYLDGGLDPQTRQHLEAHLQGCATCPPLYAALVGVRTSLGGQRDPDSVIPPALAARVLATLADAGAAEGEPRAGE